MPGKRKTTKRHFGGFLDVSFGRMIRSAGMDRTGFIEWAVIHGLLRTRVLTRKKLKTMARQGRLNARTVETLKEEGIL